ncbi:hypothetical protein BUALT_Bualt01G0108800 [Buddleja alternifolia]|uniref:Zinc finger BED domain-containing protein RICESLEEPER 2-like n=1 Tax=Buddleja alternifolia TaxID=168488 RepID=A0AAV6YA80_9LAMI|nr:hypothetical protein BUALT_Bualt01G0108800 [Buddleja alternifolia]
MFKDENKPLLTNLVNIQSSFQAKKVHQSTLKSFKVKTPFRQNFANHRSNNMEGSQANDESPILINEDGKEDNQKVETQVQEENALKRQDRRRTSKRLLTTQPLSPSEFGGGSGGTITTYKYDKEKMSPSRLHRFTEIVKQLQLSTSKGLILNVPTRWNSTYAMLVSALIFRDVFPRYKERDPSYIWLPSSEDWDRALEVCKFLEAFNDATHIFSGINYPRSNLFLPEVWKIREILSEKSSDNNKDYLQKRTSRMREKFDKYWGDCSLLMAMGAVLDPRYKMKLIEFCYSKIYPEFEAHKEIQSVFFSLHKLYGEYVNCSTSNVKLNDQSRANISIENTSSGRVKNKTKGRAEFDLWAQELDTIIPIKSDLDIYLEEGLYVCKEDSDSDFNALDWWKANTLKFRTLSSMAHDILSIPITTVASESAFSAGGRVLDQYRSSLNAETVQALVCTGDWLRSEWNIAKSAEVKIRDHKGCVDDRNKVSS